MTLTAYAFAAPTYPWLTTPPDAANSLARRISVPRGCQRVTVPADSYAEWLRNLPLRPGCPPVHLYDGQVKYPSDIHAAVVKLDVGSRDLQQCADTVIRLRAEYLFSRKQTAAIHFNFTSGFRADYAKWTAGYRVSVHGNRVSWVKTARPDASHAAFRSYLDTVFTYAGSASLNKEMVSVKADNMQIGDVFIRPGFPGHASNVVDMAVDLRTGKKYFLLAEGFMPAQEMHLLKNPSNPRLSPWYPLDFGPTLNTPEYTFQRSELKRFQ